MARGKTLQVVFKQNFQNQGMLLPPDLNDLIAQNHPEDVHGHHSDPKFMGGDPAKNLTKRPVSKHKQLHKDLNCKFR